MLTSQTSIACYQFYCYKFGNIGKMEQMSKFIINFFFTPRATTTSLRPQKSLYTQFFRKTLKAESLDIISQPRVLLIPSKNYRIFPVTNKYTFLRSFNFNSRPRTILATIKSNFLSTLQPSKAISISPVSDTFYHPLTIIFLLSSHPCHPSLFHPLLPKPFK